MNAELTRHSPNKGHCDLLHCGILISVSKGRLAQFFIAVLSIAVLTVWADVGSLAQTEDRRPLERVEVNPPNRQARSEAIQTQGSGFTDPIRSDPSSSDSSAPSTASGFGSGLPYPSVVTEKSGVSIGSAALPSQVQVINRDDIERLNVRDPTDLVRRVTGMSAVTYGQGDVGSPFGMRGFFGNHGTNTAVFVDGVPQNWPSATETHGMMDIAYLTPEMIERIEIIKGPFSALYGDFALSGVVNIVTRSKQASPSVSASYGSFGAIRGTAGLSSERWCPTPFIFHEYYQTDGYRDNSKYKRWSPFNKISMPVRNGVLSLRANYFTSTYGAPGYLNINDVKNGTVNRTAAVNPADGGNQGRYSLVMNYSPLQGEAGLYAVAYVENYQPVRWATYPPTALPYPNQTQWMALDQRVHWGGRFFYNFVYSNVGNLSVGLQTRQDTGAANTYNAVDRNITGRRYEYDLGLSNWAWFAQGQVRLADTLKVVGGVRGDYFNLGIDNVGKPANSGTGYPSTVSPKVGVVVSLTKNLNVFANKGLGFRSPAATEMSPSSSAGLSHFKLDVAQVDSYDVGFNGTFLGNLYFGAGYYQTYMQREIRTVNSQPVNVGDTVRKGYEVEAKYYASTDITLFANLGWVDAKVIDPPNPGQFLVPAVSEWTVKGGIDITKEFCEGRKLRVDAYYQYLSGPPNYAGSSTTPKYGPDYDQYNFKAVYEERGWTAFISAKLQPRLLAADYYTIQGTEVAYDPKPMWDVSGGLNYDF